MTICLPACPSALHGCLSVCLPSCLPACLSVCVSLYPSISLYFSVRLCSCVSVLVPVFLSQSYPCLSVCLPYCLSVSVYLPVCLCSCLSVPVLSLSVYSRGIGSPFCLPQIICAFIYGPVCKFLYTLGCVKEKITFFIFIAIKCTIMTESSVSLYSIVRSTFNAGLP